MRNQHPQATALQFIRDQFADGSKRFPCLFHASITGYAAVKCSVVRDYIVNDIRGDNPHDGADAGQGFAFFFGADIAGLSHFAEYAGAVIDVLNVNDALQTFTNLNPLAWHWTRPADIVMMAAYRAGGMLQSGLLSPSSGPLEFATAGIIANPQSPTLCYPWGDAMQWRDPDSDAFAPMVAEKFQWVAEAVQRGEIESVSLYRQNVFRAAALWLGAMISGDVSLDPTSPPPGLNCVDDSPTADEVKPGKKHVTDDELESKLVQFIVGTKDSPKRPTQAEAATFCGLNAGTLSKRLSANAKLQAIWNTSLSGKVPNHRPRIRSHHIKADKIAHEGGDDDSDR